MARSKPRSPTPRTRKSRKPTRKPTPKFRKPIPNRTLEPVGDPVSHARDSILDEIESAVIGMTVAQRQELLDDLSDDLQARAADAAGYFGDAA